MSSSPIVGPDQAAADRFLEACQRAALLVGTIAREQASLAVAARDGWQGSARLHFDQHAARLARSSDDLLDDLWATSSALRHAGVP